MHDDARPAARLTVLAVLSGTGPRAVVELVRARSPLLWVAVPVTTRPMREHETEGVDHHFVDSSEFARMVAAGELLEWVEIGGHRYGTPGTTARARLRTGRPVLVPTDPGGARRIRAALPQAQLVLLAAPGGPGGLAAPARPEDSTGRGDLAAPARPGDSAGSGDFDATLVNDCVERVADELVGLLGSSFLTPAHPRNGGSAVQRFSG